MKHRYHTKILDLKQEALYQFRLAAQQVLSKLLYTPLST